MALGKALVKGTVRRADSLAEVAVVAAAGIACSQLGAFMQQYAQNLAGRLAEASRDVAGIAERAAEAGLARDAYIGEFLTAANPVFRREGAALQAKLDHAGELQAAYDALQSASLLGRPVRFIQHLDADIAANVWRHFQPALPLDAASLVYAGLGIVLALVLYQALKAILLAPFRLGRARPAG